MIFELPVFSLFPTCQILYFFSHLCFFYFSFFIEITLVYNNICSMCTRLHFYFYIHYSVLTIKILVFIHYHTVDSLYSFHLSLTPFPSGNHYSILREQSLHVITTHTHTNGNHMRRWRC